MGRVTVTKRRTDWMPVYQMMADGFTQEETAKAFEMATESINRRVRKEREARGARNNTHLCIILARQGLID